MDDLEMFDFRNENFAKERLQPHQGFWSKLKSQIWPARVSLEGRLARERRESIERRLQASEAKRLNHAVPLWQEQSRPLKQQPVQSRTPGQ